MLASTSSNTNFLVPTSTFLLEVVAFGLFLWLIARYVLPPLRNAMDKRAEFIRTSLESAETAKREAEESAAKRREVLEAARAEARTIVDQANEIADQLKEEGRQRGQAEHDRLVAGARADIDQERERARSEVMSDLGSLVLQAAERVIGASIDDERHRALVDEAIAAAEGTTSGGSH